MGRLCGPSEWHFWATDTQSGGYGLIFARIEELISRLRALARALRFWNVVMGFARGIYKRSIADDRYAGRQILKQAQWCFNTMISASLYTASRLVCGSNPADFYGWGDQEEALLFAQDISVSGQFAQQWELRMLAREAASEKVANSTLRRLLAYTNTPNCADVKIGDSVLCYKAPSKRSAPKWFGPACALDIDEAGVMKRYPSQTFKVPRTCVRKRADTEEAGSKHGPLGLEMAGPGYNQLVLDPPAIPSALDSLKDAGDKNEITLEDSVSRGAELRENALGGRVEGRAHQPLSRVSSTVTPDSPRLSFQITSPSLSFDKKCAPARAPASASGSTETVS